MYLYTCNLSIYLSMNIFSHLSIRKTIKPQKILAPGLPKTNHYPYASTGSVEYQVGGAKSSLTFEINCWEECGI